MITFKQQWRTKSTSVISARITLEFEVIEIFWVMVPVIAMQMLQQKKTPMTAITFLVAWISVFLETGISVNFSIVLFSFLTCKRIKYFFLNMSLIKVHLLWEGQKNMMKSENFFQSYRLILYAIWRLRHKFYEKTYYLSDCENVCHS